MRKFAAVKKVTAAILLFIMLCSTTEFSQLCKIPDLISHYIEHKQTNPSLSFISFLSIHYAQKSIVDADYDKDMKLPFKNGECMDFHVSVVFLNTTNYGVIIRPVFRYIKKPLVREQSLVISSFIANIWQPPKSC